MARPRPSAAGGFPVAIGAIIGFVLGYVFYEPVAGLVIGVGLGVAVAVAIWLRDRNRVDRI